MDRILEVSKVVGTSSGLRVWNRSGCLASMYCQ